MPKCVSFPIGWFVFQFTMRGGDKESGQQRQGDGLCDPYIHEGYSSSSSYSDSVIKPATDGITQQEPQKHY